MPVKKDRFSHVGTPAQAPITPSLADPLDVPYEETVQLNVNVSPALRKAIRLKALEEGVPVTVALRRVLQAWVESK